MPGAVEDDENVEPGVNMTAEQLQQMAMDAVESGWTYDPNDMIEENVVEFHAAVENKNLAAVQAALDAGVDVNAKGVNEDTALHLACLYGGEEIVPLLLSKGADVNAKDEDSGTPLHDAAAGGYVELIVQLMDANADVTAADKDGDTPLHSAANGNHQSAVAALLLAGANPSVRNGAYKTPGQLARDPDVLAVMDAALAAASDETAASSSTENANSGEVEGAGAGGSGSVDRCSLCLAAPGADVKLLVCSNCKSVKYCSKECQKSHWKVHKPDCRKPEAASTD